MNLTYKDEWDVLLEKGAQIKKSNGKWLILLEIDGKLKWKELTEELFRKFL